MSNNTWVESGRLRLICLSGRGVWSGEGGDPTKVEKKDEWQINEIFGGYFRTVRTKFMF